jgi:nucleotide-binding universal stress UspA family protein
MDRVLVPLDGSPLAEQALVVGADLAARAGAELHLVTVYRRPVAFAVARDLAAADASAHANAREYLDAIAGRVAADCGVTVRRGLLHGEVAEAIAGYAEARRTDLVVMTTHGRGPASRFWVGGTADRLVGMLRCPLLTFRPDAGLPAPRLGAEPMVVPLDGSVLGDAAIEPAVALARITGAPLALVHIVDPSLPAWSVPPADIALPTSGWPGARHLAAARLLHELAAGLRARDVRAYATMQIASDVPGAVLRFAEKERAGLIAIPLRPRGSASRCFLGGVAGKLLRGSRVPVLVCRRAEPERPRIGAAEASELAVAGG